MGIRRREFIKGCVATCTLLLPGIASVNAAYANSAPSSDVDSHIEKSIKANFGSGFSVKTHTQAAGLTYADVEHFGNRYKVVSDDLLDWKVLGTF